MPIEKRCLYEHINRGDYVKFYLDYEYYKTDQNKMIDVNRAISCIQQLFIDVIKMLSNDKNIYRQDMVVLESSSDVKESLHIILDVFVEEVFRLVLLATVNHECLRNKNNVNKEFNDQSSFMKIIDAFRVVWEDWFTCIHCKIKNTTLSVSDVYHLFVYSLEKTMVPSVDFKVYGVEQDFRMFMCTKRGEVRPLKRSVFFQNIQISVLSIDVKLARRS